MMSLRCGLGFVAMAAGGFMAGPDSVWAQSFDYGAMETLFGEPVTTSVTGAPQRASDVPATMEIITADDIRRSGAHDLPGVLRHVEGVDVLQWTNDDADVSIRGDNGPGSARVLVLIDGRQVYADYWGFTPWSALPVELSAIRQIEVVKGPNSALFGFNAVGGVINIVTYNPLYDHVNTASMMVGTQGLAQGSAVGTADLGDFGGVRISAGGRSNEDFSTPQSLAEQGTRRGDDRGAMDVDSVFRLSPTAELGLEVSHVNADQDELSPLVVPDYVNYTTDSVKGQLTARTDLGQWQATAYSNWITGQYFATTEPTPNLVAKDQVTVVQVQDIVSLGNSHTLRGTVEYRNNAEDTTPLGGGRVSYDTVSAGGMWEWRVAPRVTLTNAVRIDDLMLGRDGSVPDGYPFTNADWNRSLLEESFNSGLVWNMTPSDTLRLIASRGVQLPNLINFGAFDYPVPASHALPVPIAGFTGSPLIQPSIVSNYELAWDRNLSWLNGELRVAAYHQTTDQVSGIFSNLAITPGSIYLTSSNVADSDAEGLELGLKGKFLGNWRWGLSYTPEIVTDHFAPGQSNVIAQVDFQNTTPTHVVNANLGWSKDRWEVDGFLRYESTFYGLKPDIIFQEGNPLTRVEGYVSIDARVGYKVTDWLTVALSGQNVTTASQQQTSDANVERRVIGSLTASF